MWKAPLYVLLLFVSSLAFVHATPVQACTTDAECDNGDTCSLPDVCNQGSCELGGGGDANSDLICDGEYVSGIDLHVTKLVIRTFPSGGPSTATIRGSGNFIDVVRPFSTTAGIAIRVKDVLSEAPPAGDGVDITLSFSGSDCTTSGDNTTCRLLSGPNQGSQAKFKRDPLSLEQIKFTFRLRGIDLTKPFFGPVRMILTDDTTVHRPGKVTDCRLFATGIKCREF